MTNGLRSYDTTLVNHCVHLFLEAISLNKATVKVATSYIKKILYSFFLENIIKDGWELDESEIHESWKQSLGDAVLSYEASHKNDLYSFNLCSLSLEQYFGMAITDREVIQFLTEGKHLDCLTIIHSKTMFGIRKGYYNFDVLMCIHKIDLNYKFNILKYPIIKRVVEHKSPKNLIGLILKNIMIIALVVIVGYFVFSGLKSIGDSLMGTPEPPNRGHVVSSEVVGRTKIVHAKYNVSLPRGTSFIEIPDDSWIEISASGKHHFRGRSTLFINDGVKSCGPEGANFKVAYLKNGKLDRSIPHLPHPDNFPIPSGTYAVLIGKVGEDGDVFVIGKYKKIFIEDGGNF